MHNNVILCILSIAPPNHYKNLSYEVLKFDTPRSQLKVDIYIQETLKELTFMDIVGHH